MIEEEYPRYAYFVRYEAERGREADAAGDLVCTYKACHPEKRTSFVQDVPPTCGIPVVRDRARSKDVRICRVPFDDPNKVFLVAVPVSMVSSAGRVFTTAVSVPISVDPVMAVEGDENATSDRASAKCS